VAADLLHLPAARGGGRTLLEGGNWAPVDLRVVERQHRLSTRQRRQCPQTHGSKHSPALGRLCPGGASAVLPGRQFAARHRGCVQRRAATNSLTRLQRY